jgi:hypothetical protein
MQNIAVLLGRPEVLGTIYIILGITLFFHHH